jgi:hypothetical protein
MKRLITSCRIMLLRHHLARKERLVAALERVNARIKALRALLGGDL